MGRIINTDTRTVRRTTAVTTILDTGIMITAMEVTTDVAITVTEVTDAGTLDGAVTDAGSIHYAAGSMSQP